MNGVFKMCKYSWTICIHVILQKITKDENQENWDLVIWVAQILWNNIVFRLQMSTYESDRSIGCVARLTVMLELVFHYLNVIKIFHKDLSKKFTMNILIKENWPNNLHTRCQITPILSNHQTSALINFKTLENTIFFVNF